MVLSEEQFDLSIVRLLLTAVGLGVLVSGWTRLGASGDSTAGVALESTTGLDFGEKNEVIDLNPGCAVKDEAPFDAVLAFGFPIAPTSVTTKNEGQAGKPWALAKLSESMKLFFTKSKTICSCRTGSVSLSVHSAVTLYSSTPPPGT